jgi:hypothetical protein
MRKFFFILLLACSLYACDTIGVGQTFSTVDELQQTKQLHLVQHYTSISERPIAYDIAYYSNAFEFINTTLKNGERKTQLLLTIKTQRGSYNLKKQLLLQIDSVNYQLPFVRVEIENDEVSYTSTTSTPRTENITVCIPSSTQEVTKSDGTKETVTIPATSETKTVTVYDNSTINNTDFLRKDKAIVALDDEIIAKIKNSKQFAFKIYYDFHGVWLKPDEYQKRNLKAFL